jgi:1-acyl-sn-glycerol-3-phosphate acyltransferase
MRESLGQAWRALATGFCFFVFGAGELVEAFMVFPAIFFLVRDEAKRRRLAKRVMQLSFKAFVELMRFTGVLHYDVKNKELLERPGLLVVANHPSLIDVVFLISFLKRADCIVKDSLIKNPFTRYAILAAGLIPNAAGGEDLVERCAQSLADGNCLVIFPEGSRSEIKSLLPFQRGTAHIALRSRRDITPVAIHVGAHNLGRDSKWWRAPKKPMSFSFEVLPDIPLQPFFERKEDAPIVARELTDFLSGYFRKEINENGCERRP